MIQVTALAAAVFTLGIFLAGCSSDISADTVRDMDKQRRETAEKMPGNDIPLDPADRAR